MTNSKAAKSFSNCGTWWSSRVAGFSWPFPATPPIYMRFFRYGAASDTRCQSGLRSNNATHWQIFRLACRPRGRRSGRPDEKSRRPRPVIDVTPLLGLLFDYRRRRTIHNPTAPLSKISAVLGSGAGVTAAGVTVIVSTKKSQPLAVAFGVVIVTEVIGCAAPELREKLPKPLAEELAAMPVKAFMSTRVAPENASTT